LGEFGQPEGLPKLEGKRMLMIISPKGKKKKEA
jgi:translation initiation factor IF-3